MGNPIWRVWTHSTNTTVGCWPWNISYHFVHQQQRRRSSLHTSEATSLTFGDEMATDEKSIFHLQVLRAEKLRGIGRMGKSPNAYVKIVINDFVKNTEVVKRNSDPSWGAEFTFNANPSSTIILRVKHDPFAFQSKLLGCVEIEIFQLLELGEGKKDIVLKLKSTGEELATADTGNIIIRIWSEDNVQVSTAGLETARKAVKERLEDEKSATKSLGRVVSKLQVFAAIVDEASKVHPYVSIVWKAAASMYKIVEKQIERDENVIELMSSMDDAYTSITEIRSISDQTTHLKRSVQAVISQTFECAIFIQEYAGRGFSKRALRDTFSANATDRIEQFTKKFVELKRAVDSGVGFQTMLVSSRMLERVETIATKQSLETLQPAQMDPYGRPECLPGTRVEMLASITDWVTNSQSSTNILWLHGVAGSGKSTLANTVSNLFLGMRRLGAHLFFSRNTAENAPAFVIRTLAYQLGSYDPRIGHAISAAMEDSRHVIRSPSLLQFQQLIVEPLASINTLQFEGPIVIVIDALDECGNPEDREELLDVLGKELSNLPSVMRFIVTSRPEYDIRNHFESANGVTSLEVKVTSVDTQKDIEAFITFRLNRIRERNKILRLPDDWPGHSRIEALVERASGLFIWASTACKFIDTHDPEARLGIVLQTDVSSNAKSSLDSLYGTALESAGSWDDAGFGADFQAVIGTLLVARDRLSASAIDNLLDGQRPSLHAISRLGCLLYMNSVIRILHPSFADFLSNIERCKSVDWFIDVTAHNLRIATCCIGRLSGFLKRNVCNLKLSETPPSNELPEDVIYACMFWVEHVSMVGDTSAIVDTLEAFLFSHLLHWLEAMSILQKSSAAIGILQHLLSWTQTFLPSKLRLQELVYDGHRFSQAFVNTIADHPLLVYASALPFTPSETLLYRTFLDKSQSTWLSLGFEKSWSPMICVHEHKQNVHSLAFSPDGKKLASFTGDSLRLRDTLTGVDLVYPISLNSGRGTGAVTFSPDGTHVASSWRGKIDSDAWDLCEWNASSGSMILGPLNTGPVADPYNSVAFSRCSVLYSPDGTIIATCNPEGKIFLWNTSSAHEMFAPLNGTGAADCADLLAFFSDSSQLVSTAQSGIFVWDLITGKLVLGPLIGDRLHNTVDAISVSPDGLRIFSAARGILRTWHARSGALTRSTKLVPGEHRYRRAAAFSPDSTQVALGQADGSILVFDTTSGEQLQSISEQYGSGLYLLVFSPDSRTIAAAFHDLTVHIYSLSKTKGLDVVSQGPDPYPRIKLLPSYPGNNFVVFTARSPDGPAIHVMDSISGMEIADPIFGIYISPVNHVKTVKFVEDGLRVAFVAPDRSVRIRQLGSDPGFETVIRRENHFMPSLMDMSADGKRVVVSDCASAWHDGYAAVEIWDTTTGDRILGPIRGSQAQNGSMTFSPDGTRVLSLGSVLCVWDTMTGAVIFEKDADTIVKAGYSNDGLNIVTHGHDDEISRLDATTGSHISSFQSFPRIAQSSHLDRFAVDSTDRWIKEVETSKRICQLPPTLRDSKETSSSNTSITIHTNRGLVVMQFPSSVLDT